MRAKLLILLVSGGGEWVEGLRRALTEALDPKVQLEISAAPTEPRATAELTVVTIDFPQGARDARVRLRTPRGVTERQLTFELRDAAVERGRALGFFVSAMVPELRAARVAVTAPVAPPPPAKPRHVEPAPERPEAVAAAEPPRPAPAEPAPPPPEAEPAQPVEPAEVQAPLATPARTEEEVWRISVGASGVGAWGPGRQAPEGGGRVALQVHLGRFAVRAGALALGGAVPQASATSVCTGPFIGAWAALIDGTFTLALRVDVAALWLQVARGDERQSRWLVSAQPRLEASVRLAKWLWVEVAAGADLGSSPTRVIVDERQVAELSPYAAALEAGLRAAF